MVRKFDVKALVFLRIAFGFGSDADPFPFLVALGSYSAVVQFSPALLSSNAILLVAFEGERLSCEGILIAMFGLNFLLASVLSSLLCARTKIDDFCPTVSSDFFFFDFRLL